MGAFNLVGSIALAPVTGGASLFLGAASSVAAIGGIATIATTGEINNNKGSTICLRNEIKETGLRPGKWNNQNAQNIKEQYEARIEQPVNIKNCVIM